MYHLFKSTRIYQGKPYCGPSTDEEPAEYPTLESAKKARDELNVRNPVGWNIWYNGALVDGFDHFAED